MLNGSRRLISSGAPRGRYARAELVTKVQRFITMKAATILVLDTKWIPAITGSQLRWPAIHGRPLTLRA